MPELSHPESDFLSVIEWDWSQVGSAYILHAAESFEGDDGLVPVGGPGITVCGRKGRLGIPGIFSRMGAPRCKQCCRKLDWPEGKGSPKNVPELRGLAEARMSRWDGWHPTPEMAAAYAEAVAEVERFTEELKALRKGADGVPLYGY